MKPVIVTLVFLCAGNICNAQSQKEKFITYGLQKDRAETAAARGEHAQAMAIYDSAFATLPFLGYDYYDAVLNALEAGSDERANNLLIQGTENGLVVEGLYDSTIISFLQSERCMPYLNMRDYMKACWLSRADTAKIRKMKELGSWWVMIEDTNGNLTKQKDSTAYDRLLVFVKENGWPTTLEMGNQCYYLQYLLLNCLDNYPDNPKWQQVLPYIQGAINRGTLPPDYLAPFQDMADIAAGRPMTYGTLLDYYWDIPSNRNVVERNTLDANRRSIGLGPISDFLFRKEMDPEDVHFVEP
jgi:hypothetical protein